VTPLDTDIMQTIVSCCHCPAASPVLPASPHINHGAHDRRSLRDRLVLRIDSLYERVQHRLEPAIANCRERNQALAGA